MTFPKGLAVGRSRLVTLKKGSSLPGAVVNPKWKPLGPTLDFSGAFNTSGKSIVLAMESKTDPVKTASSLVVAMEVGSFLRRQKQGIPSSKGGLCSGLRAARRPVTTRANAGWSPTALHRRLRMQFGLVPHD